MSKFLAFRFNSCVGERARRRRDGRLAAVLAALEAEETGATRMVLVSENGSLPVLRKCSRKMTQGAGDNLHATADVAGTTTAQLHHVLLGVLSQRRACKRSGHSAGIKWESHTGCSVTTRSVDGVSGLVGCWFWTVPVEASQVAAGVESCLGAENQEKRPLPNILIWRVE